MGASWSDNWRRAEPQRALTYRVALPAQWKLPDATRTGMPSRESHGSSPRRPPRIAGCTFQARGVSPAQVIDAANEAVILNLVASGAGASIAREELMLASAQQRRIAVWTGAELTPRYCSSLSRSAKRIRCWQPVRGVLRDVWRHE